MQIKPFFHQDTKTFTYVVYKDNDAVIIDPVLDFNQSSTTIGFNALDEIVAFIEKEHLEPKVVLDTHMHADHMSGAYYLKKRLKVKSAIGRNFLTSQEYFAKYFEMAVPKNAYDILLEEGTSSFGQIKVKTMFTPGHTPSCAAYLIEDALFSGDALFNPELGCGRCDFVGGSALDLYNSITKKIFAENPDTRIFVGHDYPKAGEPKPETSVKATKEQNILINAKTSKEDFIEVRTKRDQSLSPPMLMPYAIQVNICGGKLPEKFLKVPISWPQLGAWSGLE